MKSSICLLLIYLLAQTSNAQIFVDHAATGANNGTSWTDAFASLQDGIDASAPGNGTNQVFVAQGTYFPDEGASQTNNDRNASFSLKSSISILGGFASGDLLADRDPATKVTILSGDIDQNPATSSTANSHHVVTANSVSSDAVLDGCTIRDGDATTVNPQEGGGILCINFGSATFRNCIIENNTADNGGAVNIDDSFPSFINCTFQNNSVSVRGGAIRIESGADPSIINCTFRNNTATDDGGAIHASGTTTDFFVRDSLFEDNTANDNGGAINTTSNTPEIRDCIFRRNHAIDDGGAINYGGRVNTIEGCVFENNTADEHAGAVRLTSDLTLENCTFTSNSSRLEGGAIHTSGSGAEFFLLNCTFTSNQSTSNRGGAVSNEDNPCSITDCTFTSNSGTFGGAIFNDNSDALITNCLFEGNIATTRSGGAVSGTGSADPTFTNCAFAGNSASFDGGAFQQTNGVPHFINCTFQGNACDEEGGAVSIPRANFTNCLFWQNSADGETSTQLASIDFRSTQSFSTFSHCMVENFTKNELDTIGASTATNFDAADPLFIIELDPLQAPQTGSSLSLQAGATGSPFIDAGDSSANITTSDIIGNPRIDNIIDLGAFEVRDLNLFVDSTAIGNNDGSSFTNAFSNLTDALAATVPGSVINLATGTYTPSNSGDRSATFTIPDNIQIIGGFPSGGSATPDPALHPTILSGDLDADDDPDTNRSDNSFHVVTFNNAGPNTILNGLTISGGQSDGPNAADQEGAGLLFINSSPTINNCLLIDNHAATSGGGAHLSGSSSPSFTSCLFTENSGNLGAGVSIQNTATPLFTTCIFENNSATQVGGAAFILAASPTFQECQFDINTALSGGAIFTDNASSILNLCVFRENSATNGGALATTNSSNSVLTSCIFEENTATDGGAILSDASEPTLLTCSLKGNSADRGGAIFSTNTPAPSVTNTICQGNFANDSGGAIFNLNASPSFINLSAQGNAATNTGGAIFESGTSAPQYLNCVVWENAADSSIFGIGVAHDSEETATPTFSHCLIQELNLLGSNNNLNGTDLNNNPRFIIPVSPFSAPQTGGSLIPRFDSTILNLGDDDANATTIDFNESPRKVGPIDLGAIEHQGILHVYLTALDPLWPNRHLTLSSALQEAIPGHTIFVERRRQVGSFTLPDGIEIYGGFQVGETLEERDPQERTQLAGQSSAGTGEHLDRIVSAINISETTLLDGFQIQEGIADGSDPNIQTGAGLFCDNSSPRLRNCNIQDNESIAGGAGVHLINNSNPTFDNCIIRDNTTTGNGAGILIEGSSSILFDNSQIIANTGTGDGGGLHITNSQNLEFNRCQIKGNTATNGGGLFLEGDLTITLGISQLTGNSGSASGGAICQTNGCTLISANTTFSANSANDGAAIACEDSITTLFCNTFQGNSATNSGGSFFADNSDLTFLNTIIWHNHANEDRSISSASLEQTNSQLSFGNCLVENFSKATLDGFTESADNLEPIDPLFLGELDPNDAPNHTFGRSYHLRPSSPALDTGGLDEQFFTLLFPFFFSDGADNNRFVNDALDLGALEHQGFIFVDENATGGNFGETWEDALTNLHDALEDAAGHFILIAEGSYFPSIVDDTNTQDADAFFNINEAQLFGGFQAGDAFEDREPNNHLTTLSGEIESSPNSEQILSLTNSSAHLEGLITSGARSFLDTNHGFLCDNSTVTLIDCTFDNNDISQVGQSGGGIQVSNQSQASFSNCLFTRNSTPRGSLRILQSSVNIVDTVFADNNANNFTDGGGATYCEDATVSFIHCEFRDNFSGSGSSSLAETTGGGAVQGNNSLLDFTNCLFRGNRALQNVNGSNFLLENGGAAALYDSAGSFINCSFQGNLASNGGGIYFDNSPFSVVNCSFQGNVAMFDFFVESRDENQEQPTSGFGGAAFITGEAPSFTNTIVWHNSADLDRSSQSASIEFDETLTNPLLLPIFSHCLIENFTAAELDASTSGSSNLPPNPPFFFQEIDALFANESFINHIDTRDSPRDLRLLPGSPAIDAGDNSANSTTTDLLESPRIQNTSINLGAIEDLGPDLDALFDTDNDGDGLPFGLETAIGSNPDLDDSETANTPAIFTIEGENSPIPLFGSGFNPLAESFTIWVIEHSSDLEEFNEVLRYNGPLDELTVAPGFIGTLNPSGDSDLPPLFVTDSITALENEEAPDAAFYRLKVLFGPGEQ